MRPIKALGLGVVAALAAMAFIGVTSASAVSLCKEKGEGACPKEKAYPAKTVISGKISKQVEGTDEKEFSVECSESEWSGETSAESGEPLKGVLSSSLFDGCTSTVGEVPCTWVLLNLPWAWALSPTGGGNGTFKYTNGGNGVPGLRITCGGAHCRYGAAEIKASVLGGAPAVASINQVLTLQTDNPENSPICGPNFTYRVTWIVSPSPMYIR